MKFKEGDKVKAKDEVKERAHTFCGDDISGIGIVVKSKLKNRFAFDIDLETEQYYVKFPNMIHPFWIYAHELEKMKSKNKKRK